MVVSYRNTVQGFRYGCKDEKLLLQIISRKAQFPDAFEYVFARFLAIQDAHHFTALTMIALLVNASLTEIVTEAHL